MSLPTYKITLNMRMSSQMSLETPYDIEKYVFRMRHIFHSYPELCSKEYNTLEIIFKELESSRFQPVLTGRPEYMQMSEITLLTRL